MNRQQFITILIVSFIAVVAWLIFEFLHTQASVQPNPNVQQLLDPIDPNFDQDTLNIIKDIGEPTQISSISGQTR